MRLLFLSITSTLLLTLPIFAERKIEFVQAIWRHGDRAPQKHPYPNDIYTEKYWPRGWKQLTNVLIHSSDSSRALASAYCMAAGLYPAKGEWQWQNGNSWQPIPVTTITRPLDDLFTRPTMFDCKNAEDISRISSAAATAKVDKEYGDMYPRLANWTGIENFGHKGFHSIYNIYREIQHNLTQPEWVYRRWPNHDNMTTLEIADKLKTIRSLNWFGTNQIGPYYGGFLVNDFIRNANITEIYSRKNKTHRRFIGYSSHDDDIMAFQGALGVQNGLSPPYASIMIMEVYSNRNEGITQFEVELLYRNDTSVDPYKLEIPGCGTPCLVSKLSQIYKNVMIATEDEVFERCGNDDYETVAPPTSKKSHTTVPLPNSNVSKIYSELNSTAINATLPSGSFSLDNGYFSLVVILFCVIL